MQAAHAPAYAGAAPFERRRQVRHPASGEVRVTILTPRIWPDIRGVALDASESGMGLLVDQPATATCTLMILREGSVTMGEVRNCIPAGNKYRIGVSITDVYRHRSTVRRPS